MSDPRHDYVGIRFASGLGCTPVVIELDGELDYCAAPTVEGALAAACRPATDLVIDVSGLRFCDCAGLSALLRTAQRLEAASGRLRLAAAQPRVSRLLTLAGTPAVIPMYPVVGDAVEASRLEGRTEPTEAAETYACDGSQLDGSGSAFGRPGYGYDRRIVHFQNEASLWPPSRHRPPILSSMPGASHRLSAAGF